MATVPIPDLMQSFLDEAWEAAVVFEQTQEFLAIGRHEPLVIMAHRLKGSAGLYGFPQISRLAGLMERILEGAPHYTGPQREQVVEFVTRASACLTEALDRVATTGKEGGLGLELGRLGAGELIQELAFINPAAFTPKTPEPKAAPTPVEQSQASAVAELQRFYQETPEFWEFFAPETSENLDAAGAALEGILKGDPGGAHLGALFRGMHTIKGAAYSVGCKPIGELAHQLEDVLVAVREGQETWTPAKAQLMLEGAEAIHTMLAAAEGKESKAVAELPQTLRRLEATVALVLGREVKPEVAAQPQSQAESQAEPQAKIKPEVQAEAKATTPDRGSVRVGLDKLDNLLNIAGETLATRSRLELLVRRFEELGEVLETARLRLVRTSSDFETRYLNPRLSLEAEKSETAPSTSLGKTVSELFSELEFDRYDDLNILARSIGEMTADLAEVRGELSERIRGFRQETESFSKLSQNLRTEVGRARLVPIGRFFQRLQRQVRQIADEKPLLLDFYGENLEIDSMVLDGLSEALIHLVNNAVIHGLESPDERQQGGKSPEGRLTVRARQQRNFLVLEVEDDGRGIDLEGVKHQALSKGLRSAEEVSRLSPEEAALLIFLPGLSTAKAVTTEAGRGVGMHAVASTVRRLRGEISVETRAGLGTVFRLRVPQTLVVSEILLLEAGGQTLALPRESVLTLLTTHSDLITGGQFDLEGEPIQVQHLSQMLGLPGSTGKDLSVALVEGREGLIGLAGERFVGLEQALVKPLGEPLSEMPHVAGATVSATGEVILVLSPAGLLALHSGASSYSVESVSHNPAKPASMAQTAPILLVDDSLSVRRIVGQMLRKAGYSVITASDGQEALEMLENQNFCAVVTDLEMPRMSGFELIEEVRRRPGLAQMPMAVLTTRASSKHRDLALELGANAYLTKPLDEVELDQFLSNVERGVTA